VSEAGPSERPNRRGEYLLTFLDYADLTADSNFAERQIRPAVVQREGSRSNRS
jgi:hypothetical protein